MSHHAQPAPLCTAGTWAHPPICLSRCSAMNARPPAAHAAWHWQAVPYMAITSFRTWHCAVYKLDLKRLAIGSWPWGSFGSWENGTFDRPRHFLSVAVVRTCLTCIISQTLLLFQCTTWLTVTFGNPSVLIMQLKLKAMNAVWFVCTHIAINMCYLSG